MNNGPLESYKYLDSKPVYMLSTKHGSSHLVYQPLPEEIELLMKLFVNQM